MAIFAWKRERGGSDAEAIAFGVTFSRTVVIAVLTIGNRPALFDHHLIELFRPGRADSQEPSVLINAGTTAFDLLPLHQGR